MSDDEPVVRRSFLDVSEVACLSFESDPQRGKIITVVLKSGYWFIIPRTPESVAALESFCSQSVKLEGPRA